MLTRRTLTILLSAIGLISFLSLFFRTAPTRTTTLSPPPLQLPDSILKGSVISSKIGNETVKADLGRAAWRLLHTTMAKFPDRPSADEQTALFTYIHLFARLYPCGECATHFQAILARFPPQVSTRSSAAAWACHVHNEVNRSLKKALFDCSAIGEFYDCGCAEEGEGKGKEGGRGVKSGEKEKESRIDLRVEKMGKIAGG